MTDREAFQYLTEQLSRMSYANKLEHQRQIAALRAMLNYYDRHANGRELPSLAELYAKEAGK